MIRSYYHIFSRVSYNMSESPAENNDIRPDNVAQDVPGIINAANSYVMYKAMSLIILLLLLWFFVKNAYCRQDLGRQGLRRQGLVDLDFTSIRTPLYDNIHDKPPQNVVFVSHIHDYWEPKTIVALDADGNPYMPIHNSNMGYYEQMQKFR